MGVTNFLKSMFAKNSDDNDATVANLPVLQSKKNNGNSNANANANRSNGNNRVSQNNTNTIANYNNQESNNGSLSNLRPSTPRVVTGIEGTEDFYVTSEHFPRITSEDLPSFQPNTGNGNGNDNSNNKSISNFTQPIFDLDSFTDSSESNEIPNNPSTQNNLAGIEAITQGHVLLGETSNIPDHILDLVTPTVARDYKVLPVKVANGELSVLSSLSSDNALRPTAERVISNRMASKKLNYKIKFYYVEWSLLKSAIDLIFTQSEFDGHSITLQHKDWINNTDGDTIKALVLDASTKGFTQEQNEYKSFITQCLSFANFLEASDLDFDLDRIPQADGYTLVKLLVRANIDGNKIPIVDEPTTTKRFRKLGVVIRSISGLDTSNDQDIATGMIIGNLAYGSRSLRVELRCNVIPQEDGIMSFSIRIQTPDQFTYTPDNLGMFPEQQQLMDKHFVRSVEGLALFSGRTGAGKNTTQMTFIAQRAKMYPFWKTVTIEDPIEMRLKGVQQFSVRKDKQQGYDYFIPGAMRHIPDMLVVGEIRDKVTAELILEASESGHFTSSTVHASNCVKTIERMITLNCDLHKLADSLKIIISQKLIGKICSKCTKEVDPNTSTIPRLQDFIAKLGWKGKVEFLRGSGKLSDGTECKTCRGTGVKGRIGIFEIMVFTNEMRDLITSRAPGYKLQQLAVKNGLTTLWMNGLRRVLLGDVSLSSVLREVGYPDPEWEGLQSLLSDTDSDIEMLDLN